MSASTVSITANPAARRRPVLVSEKKGTSIEMLAADGAIPLSNTATAGIVGVGEDKVAGGNSRDMSHHSIRGEAVLERSSRDQLQIKKVVANSTISPRRSRKVLAKPEKPRWVTILSVFTKNFVLLIVLLGLVQMIRKLALKSGEGTVENQMGFSEVEGRIAEVETSLKTTTKMFQVQVEVVDRKIENEIGGLRREVDKKIEEKTADLESGLKMLQNKGEDLERSLSELRAADWLSKQEFDQIYEELKKAKNSEFDERFTNLDDIRAYAREMIEREIQKHAADGLGRVDYALSSGGAMVVKHSEPYIGRTSNWFSKSVRNGVHSDADKMLKPSFGEPGQCFPLKGSSGFVQIKLRTAIVPEAITLEHVAKSVAYDRSSAPKDCRVSGWFRGDDANSAVNAENMFLLADFTYDLEKSNAQTFDVVETTSSGLIDTIRLDFSSNHGSPSHTCIYRVRVHGHEPYSVSMMAKS
ncbi:SUN domain-containing protein 1-like [Cucurbita maxima]|uniref:SUN domain-containing protein 1-like n=1 Tax=Cucurbita maxima TaxID=3661 RepID=A0A6J1JZV5_CUCMA|nr:SUN domain-containing protein 1-like [Cucurbita maxima]